MTASERMAGMVEAYGQAVHETAQPDSTQANGRVHDDARDDLLAAIAEIEAARDEATRDAEWARSWHGPRMDRLVEMLRKEAAPDLFARVCAVVANGKPVAHGDHYGRTIETQLDEATRRLAVVEEAVEAARDLLNSDANGGWAAKVASAVVVLNNALENPK